MFNVHALQSGLEGWFTGAGCRTARARGCGEAGWGTCIDVSPCVGGPGRCDACQPGIGHMREFRDRDIIVDEHGLHVLGRGGRDGYGHILASAQKASAFGRESSADALSEASTHNEPDLAELAAREHFMRSVSSSSWLSTEGAALTVARGPRAAVSLSGLGIKRFNVSPRSVPQVPHAKSAGGMGNLLLGDAAQLPTLKDAPVWRNKSFKVPQSSMKLGSR